MSNTTSRDIDAALETASNCRVMASQLKQCGSLFAFLAKAHLENAKGAERWAVWDDYQEECPVYRTREQAIQAAEQVAQEYANGER